MIYWRCRQCEEELEAPDSLGSDSIECPKCGLFSRPPEDQRSKIITAPKPKLPPPDDPRTTPPPSRTVHPLVPELAGPIGVARCGWIILGAGFVLTMFGMNMDTTVGDVHNYGLLNDRLAYTIVGVGIGSTGAILIGLGAVGKALAASIAER